MQWTEPRVKNPDAKSLEDKLWDAADQLRANSGLTAAEYSRPILGLIFLRFADARFQVVRAELQGQGSTSRRTVDPEDAKQYHAQGVIYLAPEARFQTLLTLPEGANVGENVNAAMRAIERDNPQLAGTLPKSFNVFDSPLLKSLLKNFSEIPVDLGFDAFGRIYEYFLGEFARTEGSKGGEFYTPSPIVRLMVEILEPFHGRILDPACGSGGMFVQSARFVSEHQREPGKELSIYGVEKTDATGQLCRMNLAVHGLEGDIRHGGKLNSYYDDPHQGVGKFDFAIANPPFNVDKVDKERLKDQVGAGRRYPFGLPKTDNANYLWIQLFYSSLNATGRAGFVMANSAGDARSSEQEIRRQLIEDKGVDVMIAVGPNMFYTVTLPCTLWFLEKSKRGTRREDKVLFMDVRNVWREIDRAHRDWSSAQIGFMANNRERFFEWKRVAQENEPRMVSLETMIRGVCEPTRLLDLVENFTLFSEHKSGVVKILGQNHQFLGVNNAIAATQHARATGTRRGGVFWHTQGSGKSFSMVFYAQKILRKLRGNWTFVIVTDRVELDDQIAKTFKACGAVADAEGDECHAQSGAHLRELLRGNHRYVFTTIHKFQTDEMLSDRDDVIVLNDEAHRSQYDTMAMNMRLALPNATFLAFTGTPLMAGEERTKEVFGDYCSIYDFQMSVEDGATVPLFYENRTPELALENPSLNEEIYAVIEEASLDEAQERKLASVLDREYHLITRDDRLETVAADIVQHFLNRGTLADGLPGKAMVVSIDKATALRMYDKVVKHWTQETLKVERELTRRQLSGMDTADLESRHRLLKSTEMALIVSPEQNEIEKMAALGLDILPHRERMGKEALDERFKDTTDPLRLVFVCAMWLTGFDAPSCSTVYLDKPMRNHTLMQTIARANRVFPGKHNGLIVDYANVFLSLEKALAIYGSGSGGDGPVKDKQALVQELRIACAEAESYCAQRGVTLAAIEEAPSGSMEKLRLLSDAVNALIAPEEQRKEFQTLARYVGALYNAVKPDPVVASFTARVMCLSTISAQMHATLHPTPVDISRVLRAISAVLDRSIAGVDVISDNREPVDLSTIDFAALKAKFEKSQHKNTELEMLRAAIRARLDIMISLNPTRIDFLNRFEELIAAYNAGAANIDDLFRQLVELTQSLGEEQQRHIRENLGEDELVVFDILTRPAPDLTDAEKAEVKKIARLLLERLKSLLDLDWRGRVSARSRIQLTIETTLDEGLPDSFSKPLFEEKVVRLFDHFYEKYPDRDHNVYQNLR